MKNNTKILIGIGTFILIILLWFVGTYNSLIKLDQTVNEKWAQVENQYQRRADLIPNLIETVKGARDFESQTQTQIAQLRTQAIQVKDKVNQGNLNPTQLREIDTEMNSILRGINIVVESYPDLKATENFLALQSQLEGTENRIATERMRYNEEIKKFNIKIKRIPSKWVASYLGYEEKEFFESIEGAEVPPPVNF